MTSTTGRLFVISGARAAGKTTVGQTLADALPRSVFIDGATIGDLVVSGREPLTEPPRIEAVEQLFLRYAGALTVADVYRSAGFDVIIADTIFGSFLDDFLMIAAPEQLHFVMLTPSVDVIRARDAARGNTAYRDGVTVEGLVDKIEHETFRVGLWIDNTTLAPGRAAAHILCHTDESLVDTTEFESHDDGTPAS